MPGIQIGQLLVEQGVLTEEQVRHILQVQKMSHRPFGDLAERLFGINPKAVEDYRNGKTSALQFPARLPIPPVSAFLKPRSQ